MVAFSLKRWESEYGFYLFPLFCIWTSPSHLSSVIPEHEEYQCSSVQKKTRANGPVSTHLHLTRLPRTLPTIVVDGFNHFMTDFFQLGKAHKFIAFCPVGNSGQLGVSKFLDFLWRVPSLQYGAARAVAGLRGCILMAPLWVFFVFLRRQRHQNEGTLTSEGTKPSWTGMANFGSWAKITT